MAKKNINSLRKMFERNEVVSWVTAYDYPFAQAAEAADVDMILVGDSLAMTHLGFDSTNPVTMDQMITFTAAARRGAPNTFLIGDMPQGSYEASNEDAVRNAIRFQKEAGVDAVKLEGGDRVCSQVGAITDANITVFGHLGLTPQSAASFGGYRVQGKDVVSYEELVYDAQRLADSGVFAILLEAIPSLVSQQIQKHVPDTPIYGVGAGAGIAGQLLIMHDLVGFYKSFRPYFAKCYIPQVFVDNSSSESEDCQREYGRKFPGEDGFMAIATDAITAYCEEVRSGGFPSDKYCYPLKEEELKALRASSSWEPTDLFLQGASAAFDYTSAAFDYKQGGYLF